MLMFNMVVFTNDCNLCLQYCLIMLGQTKKSAPIRTSAKLKLPKLNIQQQIDNHEIAQRMNQKISFTKNPRHLGQTLTYAQAFATDTSQTKFKIQPQQIFFSNYDTHHIYQSEVKLINNSRCIQRIKITPLKQKQFVISQIKYPKEESGDIAPGMAVVVSIRFRPIDLNDYQDQLFVIASDGVLKIPIYAKRQRCEINWPKSISCGHCWVGDTIKKQVIIKNRGGQASFVLLNNPLNQISFNIGYFKITPTTINFQKQSQQSITIQFLPQTQGVFKQKIKYKSYQGDQDQIQILLQGGAYSAQILLEQLNGQRILQQRINNILYFNDTQIGKEALSKIKIKNLAVVQVDYFWHFQADNLKIDKNRGKMKPSQLLQFDLMIKPNEIIPQFIRLELYLFNLPQKSLAGKVVSKNINGIQAIQCLSIDVKTKPKQSQVEVFPLHREIIQPIYQNCTVSQSFRLMNHSSIRQLYKIEKIKEDSELTTSLSQFQGFLEPNSQKQIFISLKLNKLSLINKKAYFLVSFNNSKSQVISIVGKSTFPDLVYKDQFIYYGLCKTYTKNKKNIKFYNPQKTSVEFKIHNNQRFYNLQFQDFYAYQNEQSYKTKFNIYDSKSKKEVIDWFIIAPQTELQLQCWFTTMDAASFEFQINIEIKNGRTISVNVVAQVQDVLMKMSRSQINMRQIYKGTLYNSNKFLSRQLQIINQSNHDCAFQILDPKIQALDIKILPLKGIIKKKSNQRIDLIIEPIQTGDFDIKLQWKYYDDFKVNSDLYMDLAEQIIYNNQDGKKSLIKHQQLNLKGTIKGMAMNYYIKDESRAKKIRVKIDDASQSIKMSAASLSQSMKSSKTMLQNEKLVYPLLEDLNFYNCQINQVRQVEIIIQNDSGLTTQYEIYAETFHTLVQSNNEKKYYKGLVKVEQQAFSSEMGKTFINNRILDKSQKVHLGNNKGISILCEPAAGTLHKKQSQRIMITMFNDTSGIFKDNLIINVKNHELKKIPMSFSIRGTPVSLSTNQLGINFHQETPLMNVGTILHSNGLLKKNLKVVNNGPKQIQLKWLVYRTKNLNNQDDIFNIQLKEGTIGSGNIIDLKWNAIKPQIDNDSCFTIEPKQKLIKGRQEINFNILIKEINTIGDYENLLICQPYICDSGNKIAMEPLAVILKAQAIRPQLTMDIKHKNHINKLQRFAITHEQLQTNSTNYVRKLKLKNQLKTNLTFDIAINNKQNKFQSFKILQTKTNSPATQLTNNNKNVQTSFVLTFDSILQVSIQLNGNPSNLTQWPLQQKIRKDGQLIISYSNGQKQVVDLVGWLYRPWVKVLMPNKEFYSNDNFIIDFGTVHFKNTKNITFYLINPSKADGKFAISYIKYHQSIKYKFQQTLWTPLDYEDQTIQDEKKCWKLSIDNGIVKNKTVPIHYMPGTLALPSEDDRYAETHKPVEVTIKFKPQANVLYKSKFRISVVEGPTFDIVVKGIGSYDQEIYKK